MCRYRMILYCLSLCCFFSPWLLCLDASSVPVARNIMDKIDISLNVNLTAPLVSLVCLVTGISGDPMDYEVQVFCPVVSGSRCFGNCQRMCAMKDTGECTIVSPILRSPFVQCDTTVLSESSKKVLLVVDTRQAKLSGEWYCKFGQKKSPVISLSQMLDQFTHKSIPKVSATLRPNTTIPPKSTEKPGAGLIWTPENPDDKTDQSPPKDDKERDPIFLKFARADYVIGITALLAVSLLINVGFCVRCVCARHYVEMRKRKQQPPGYLARCLCVSTVQVIEKEDAYEEIRPKLPSRNAVDRNSMRTTETTYMDGRCSLSRSNTMPLTTQQGLYYLQGVSDSMQRILYDEVPNNDSRPVSPSNLSQVSRHSRSRGSLRGLAVDRKSQQVASVPAVPEEVPFVDESGRPSVAHEDPYNDDDAGSQYSGSTRLELSRMMLRKADTLLREANTLLKETAHPEEPPAENAVH